MVSGDEDGTICLWNLADGRRQGGFSLHSAPASAAAAPTAARAAKAGIAAALPQRRRLTAMAFDASQRRLLTGNEGGEVQAWNFSSGAMLRRFMHREGQQEMAAVAFAHQAPAAAEPEPGGAVASSKSAASSDCCGSSAGDQPSDPALGADQQGDEAAAERPRASQDASWVARLGQPGPAGLGGRQLPEQAQEEGRGACLHQAACADHRPASFSESPGLVLAAGWSRRLCVWREGEEGAVGGCRRLEGHAADVLCLAPLGSDVAATGEPS